MQNQGLAHCLTPLMVSCMQQVPSFRPSLATVAARVKELMASMTEDTLAAPLDCRYMPMGEENPAVATQSLDYHTLPDVSW